MRSAIFVLVLVFSGTATSAPVPKHLMKENEDKQKLQGKWKVESIFGETIDDMAVEIRGDTIIVTAPDDTVIGKIKLEVVAGGEATDRH